MTYTVKNLRSGNLLKDAITRKVRYFESKEDAQKAAFSMTRFAVSGEKSDRYIVAETKTTAGML